MPCFFHYGNAQNPLPLNLDIATMPYCFHYGNAQIPLPPSLDIATMPYCFHYDNAQNPLPLSLDVATMPYWALPPKLSSAKRVYGARLAVSIEHFSVEKMVLHSRTLFAVICNPNVPWSSDQFPTPPPLSPPVFLGATENREWLSEGGVLRLYTGQCWHGISHRVTRVFADIDKVLDSVGKGSHTILPRSLLI